MMKNNQLLAIGIASSGRRRGNSTTLLKAYLDGVKQVGFKTQIIYLNSLMYRGCQGCDRCVQGKDCNLKDDLNGIFSRLKKAKIWALASPIYYDGVSGQLKTFFDRMRFMTYDPHKLKGPRKGIIIVTYEDKQRKDYFETVTRLANYFDWNERGDFGKVRVVAEGNLGPADAWKKRPKLLEKMSEIGAKQAMELKKKI